MLVHTIMESSYNCVCVGDLEARNEQKERSGSREEGAWIAIHDGE